MSEDGEASAGIGRSQGQSGSGGADIGGAGGGELAPSARSRPLWRAGAFRRLWIGETLSEVGSQITTIAMPLLVLSLTHSPAQAGLVAAARSIATPLTVLAGGVVADRVDRRRLMIGCALGRLTASASVVLALVLGAATLEQLFLVALLDASLFSFSLVAERSLLADLVEPTQLSEAVTLNEARSAIGYVAGPPAGGALFGLTRALPFAADVASFLVALGALAGLRAPVRNVPQARSAGIGAELREGFSWLWRQPMLRAGALLYAAANVVLNGLELLALLILRHHGVSAAGIGVAYALVGVGGLAGAALAGPLRRRLSDRSGILLEPWCYALLVPLLLVLHSVATVGPLLGVMLVPVTLSSSILVARRLALAPGHLRGRVQASSSFLAGSVSWLGPLAVGVLAQYAGDDAAVIALAAFSLATAVAATLARALRHSSAPPAATPP